MCGFIRSNIDELDQYEKSAAETEGNSTKSASHGPAKGFDTSKYDKYLELGSPLKPCTFQALEEAHRTDAAFKDLRINLGKFMTSFLPRYGISLPEGSRDVRFRPTDMVRPFESMFSIC